MKAILARLTTRSSYRWNLVLTLLVLTALTVSACGDSTTTSTSAATPSPSLKILPTPTPPGGAITSTTSTSVTGTASTGVSGTTAAGSPVTSTTAAGTPTPATLEQSPNLAYSGAREIKPSDSTTQNIVQSIGGDPSVGLFNPQQIKLSFVAAPDNATIEAFYKKAFEDAGWQLFRRDGNDTAVILIYQKAQTKGLVQIIGGLTDSNTLPDEFKSGYKAGDRIVLTALGAATAPPPTPIVIPGSPTIEVKSGQKKVFTIELDKGGTITGELYPDVAPKTVENFEKLSNGGFYNGLTFHRIEPGFVVQGGDPKGDGTGGPGYQIPGEFTTQKKHEYGTLAMARSSAPDSAGSQFYIVTGQPSQNPSIPALDGKYAIFGKVLSGMELVEKIAKGDKIKSIKVTVQ